MTILFFLNLQNMIDTLYLNSPRLVLASVTFQPDGSVFIYHLANIK